LAEPAVSSGADPCDRGNEMSDELSERAARLKADFERAAEKKREQEKEKEQQKEKEQKERQSASVQREHAPRPQPVLEPKGPVRDAVAREMWNERQAREAERAKELQKVREIRAKAQERSHEKDKGGRDR